MFMIKVIALDFVGVLVREIDVLNETEDKLERLFGPNISDEDYIKQAKERVNLSDCEIIESAKQIINKLYVIKDKELISKLKNKYPDMKIVIATNHVSYIDDFIKKNYDIDDVIISANINKIKPNHDFYLEVANIVKENVDNILFVDDNQDNIDGAKEVGMHTIKIDRGDDVYNKIVEYLG